MNATSEKYTLNWQGIALSVSYSRSWIPALEDDIGGSLSHLEIRSDDRGPLPITETGYRSRFLPASEIDAAGGPVAYVTAWLNHAEKDPAWETGKQISLF